MAKPALTWEGRRALTDSPDTSPETYKKAARQLLDNKLWADAATFFTLAGDVEGLLEMANLAADEGNFFIFQSAAQRLTAGVITRQMVENLRENAEKNGRGLYAARAAQYISEHF